MKPREDWPMVFYAKDLEEIIGLSRGDAAAVLRNAPVIDPSKRRCRAITKRALLEYLEGETA